MTKTISLVLAAALLAGAAPSADAQRIADSKTAARVRREWTEKTVPPKPGERPKARKPAARWPYVLGGMVGGAATGVWLCVRNNTGVEMFVEVAAAGCAMGGMIVVGTAGAIVGEVVRAVRR